MWNNQTFNCIYWKQEIRNVWLSHNICILCYLGMWLSQCREINAFSNNWYWRTLTYLPNGYGVICQLLFYHLSVKDSETGNASGDHPKSLGGEEKAARNYQTIKDILKRLTALCVIETPTGKKSRKHEQRLLRNMSAQSVVLDLLQIPYEKVIVGNYMLSILR